LVLALAAEAGLVRSGALDADEPLSLDAVASVDDVEELLSADVAAEAELPSSEEMEEAMALLLAEMEAAGAEPEENEEAEPAQFALAELEESAAFSKLQELEQTVRKRLRKLGGKIKPQERAQQLQELQREARAKIKEVIGKIKPKTRLQKLEKKARAKLGDLLKAPTAKVEALVAEIRERKLSDIDTERLLQRLKEALKPAVVSSGKWAVLAAMQGVEPRPGKILREIRATYTLMALLITLEEAHGRPSLLHDMAVAGGMGAARGNVPLEALAEQQGPQGPRPTNLDPAQVALEFYSKVLGRGVRKLLRVAPRPAVAFAMHAARAGLMGAFQGKDI